MPKTPIALSIQPTRFIRARSHDFGHDHEVQIALPASYASSDQAYPVLWVTDGAAYFELAASTANVLALGSQCPEFIVVAVRMTSTLPVPGTVLRGTQRGEPRHGQSRVDQERTPAGVE
ncbi:alpha/beta hydrolase-fold protein [Nocardioides sp. WG-D5]